MGEFTTNAARSTMTMRAKVQRNSTSSSNAWGGSDAPSWSAHATIACRLWSSARREVIDGDKIAQVEDIRCLFPIGADVTEDDRLEQVEDRSGAILFAGPLAINTIQRRHSHLEASLERIES